MDKKSFLDMAGLAKVFDQIMDNSSRGLPNFMLPVQKIDNSDKQVLMLFHSETNYSPI